MIVFALNPNPSPPWYYVAGDDGTGLYVTQRIFTSREEADAYVAANTPTTTTPEVDPSGSN